MSPRTNNHVTLATIAEAVGVSRMTVSNAYNRPDQLSPALRERILKAAQELGYSGPDPVARTLSRGETGSVGLVLDYPLTVAFTDQATVQFLHGVAAGCEERERGLALVPRIEGRDEALVRSALVDGFVLYCVPETDPRLAAVKGRKLPYVRVDFDPDPQQLSVNIDDEGAARTMAEHLVALGHRRFGIVLDYEARGSTGPQAQAAAIHHVDLSRLAGWRAGLEAAGIDWNRVPVASAPNGGRESGRSAAPKLLDRADRPTAILALSDGLALGVLDAAHERGIAVPQELSVAGFDDVPEAALAAPPLTTIRQPHQRKGAEAVRLLVEGQPAEHVLLPTELVVRASTGPAPRKESSP
jgi:DNA-binding LacI/PurR family transcriptional regulator